MRYCWGVKTADVLLALLPLFLSLLQHPLRPNGSQQFRDRARTTHTLPLADSIELRKRYGTVLCSYFIVSLPFASLFDWLWRQGKKPMMAEPPTMAMALKAKLHLKSTMHTTAMWFLGRLMGTNTMEGPFPPK